ncbi:MAG: glycoside hydrolase family 130 protein [Melioribacteraceae bacterium]|nr:glycoside hydrolase family 130 protein [Melioribacteraceae bacterium]
MIRFEKKNPVVIKEDIPDIGVKLRDVTSVFNPGAIKVDDTYYLMLRVQNRGRRTFFIMAQSKNGYDFEVENKVVEFKGIEKVKERIYHLYDPRLTKIEDTYYVMFAMEMEDSTQLGLGKTKDFQSFEFVDIVTKQDTRNGVLFPEKVNGKYLRFDRPNNHQVEGGPLTGNSICLSESDNLIDWRTVAKVANGTRFWDNLIGSGPPPVKTRKGWLHVYHGIAMHYAPIYQVGVMMHDLNDPSIVISRGTQCILEPREYWELVGQVPNVIFPQGLIVEEYDDEGFAKEDSEVKLYYGASDTHVGMATSTIRRLIEQSYE